MLVGVLEADEGEIMLRLLRTQVTEEGRWGTGNFFTKCASAGSPRMR